MNSASNDELVQEFWRLMGTNDFDSVAEVLSDDFVVEYPQSNERILGAQRFAQMNREYPANGRWRFIVNRLVSSDSETVSDVAVTDGVVVARVMSFFAFKNGRIHRIVDFWPDPFEPPANRAHLSEVSDAR